MNKWYHTPRLASYRLKIEDILQVKTHRVSTVIHVSVIGIDNELDLRYFEKSENWAIFIYNLILKKISKTLISSCLFHVSVIHKAMSKTF